MLIAFLALLGVDLVVLAAIAASVLARKRWVRRQPGAFRGAIQVADGELDGFSRKWQRGYGRWVHDVLVWTKRPLLLRNEVIAAEDLEAQRPARPGEVKRLGEHPAVIELMVGEAAVKVAAAGEDAVLLRGPCRPMAD